MFNLHGSFDIERRGDIIFIDMFGAWNLETAHAFKTEIETIVTPIIPAPWAALTSMTDWELCTPECEPVIVEFSLEAKKNGLAKEAVVNNKDILKLELFDRYRNEKLVKAANPDFERAFFSDSESALSWLQAEGFGSPSQT